jgi:peptide/nickel transport system permease protein
MSSPNTPPPLLEPVTTPAAEVVTTVTTGSVEDAATMSTLVRRSWGRVQGGNRKIQLGAGIIVLLLLAGLVLPLPHDPLTTSPDILQAPSGGHIMGTDQLGRDVFARTVRAARLDLPLVIASTLASVIIGVGLGLLVSTRSRLSEWAMRGLDIFQAFPMLVLAMVIVAVAGNSRTMVILALALISFPMFLRLVRAEALALRESRFIEAAVAIGATRRQVLWHHMLPNVTGVILVNAAVTASRAILMIAALSFLGIGVEPPTPSWGLMMQEGSQSLVAGEWWVSFFPGLGVLLVGLGFNLLGDGLEQVTGRGSRG